MNLRTTLQRWSQKQPGTFVWDSETGEIGGTLAAEIEAALAQALARGSAGWGPQFFLRYPVRDPRHTPREMAVILACARFILPPDLAAVYPEPPAELLHGPDDPDPSDPNVQY